MMAEPKAGSVPVAHRGRRRAVFVDVDGTLVTPAGVVPPSAGRAIAAARRAGHLVLVSTGRCPVELWDSLLALGFDGLICSAGAYVALGDEVLTQVAYPDDLLARVRAQLDERGYHHFLEGPTGVWGSRPDTRAVAQGLIERRLGPVDERLLDDGALCFLGRMRPAPADLAEPISKVVFLADRDAAVAELGEAFAGELDVIPSSVELFGSAAGEMQLPGVHKAAGIETVVTRLGLELADTVAIGDNDNDLEMLRLAGVGVAMGNAAPHVRAAADVVTGDVAADGLAAAFARLGLLG